LQCGFGNALVNEAAEDVKSGEAPA